MLKIVYKRPNTVDLYEELTVDQRMVTVWWGCEIFLTADGPEKERALALSGLPDSGKPVMRFYGDFARHILGNWSSK